MSKNTISIGGKADGNVFVVGDNISAGNIQTHVANNMPDPETVDIRKEIAALKEILAKIETPERKKLDRALEDAEEEAKKDKPDKDEIGGALERVMKYAKLSDNFAKIIGVLKPHALSASAWLGENWQKIAGMIGM
jgi:hypothetical protein